LADADAGGAFRGADDERGAAADSAADVFVVSNVAGIVQRHAQKLLGELQEQAKVRYVSPASIALVFAGLGEKDQALTWLDKAEKEHDGVIVRLKVDSRYDSLRSDPHFAEIVRRIGMPR